MKSFFFLIISFFLIPLGQAGTILSNYSEEFTKYHTNKVFSGEVTPIDFTHNPRLERFKEVLSQEVKKGPNFSGAYRIIELGCGTNCTQIIIVNIETGKIYDCVGTCGLSVYTLDSSLLIINPEAPDGSIQYPHGCITEFYFLKDG